MAIPERDTVYSNDGTNRTVYSRESSSTGWFVGIIVALALLAIGYLVFSANSGPSTPAGGPNAKLARFSDTGVSPSGDQLRSTNSTRPSWSTSTTVDARVP